MWAACVGFTETGGGEGGEACAVAVAEELGVDGFVELDMEPVYPTIDEK